jgi:hypothetical protein
MALLDNIDNFLQSPSALALASSLLNSTGYSTMPTTFGQAMGNGLMAMQAAKNQDLENQYKKAATQQTQLQNQDLQNKLANKQKLQDLIGAPAKPATAVPYRDIPGTGLLGGQIPQDQARMQMIGLLSQDNPQVALTAFGLNPKVWSKPYSAVGQDGQLHYFQVDNTTGTPREVPGYAPLPKSNTQLTYDPATNGFSFSQGPGVIGGAPGAMPGEPVIGSNAGPVAKDPTKSPARGGQGGTYTDLTTGRVFSTNTQKQTVQDQQAIAAIDRAQLQLQHVVENLPQFQTAEMQAKTGLQGKLNQYFGTNYQLPSTYAYGNAELKNSVEALMKAYQLQATDKALDNVLESYQPVPGESGQGYANRLVKQIKDLHEFTIQNKGRLNNGITLIEPQIKNDNQVNTNQTTGQQQTQPTIKTYNPKTGKLE